MAVCSCSEHPTWPRAFLEGPVANQDKRDVKSHLVHPFAQQKEELTAATQYGLNNKVGDERGV